MTQCKSYLNQDYHKIKADCLRSGRLFRDNHFPTSLQSLAKFNLPSEEVFWKRPTEITENPQFLLSHSNPNHVNAVDDSWFLSSVIAIFEQKQFFNNVVPVDQSFSFNDYCGAFHFRLWRFGEWLDVVVDDYLPVDVRGNLLYCRNTKATNEFWPSLLEKAYAKLNACYEFIEAGSAQNSLIDLTGGVAQVYNLQQIKTPELERFLSFLKKSLELNSFCLARHKNVEEKMKGHGLNKWAMAAQDFFVCKILEIDIEKNEKLCLVCLKKMLSRDENDELVNDQINNLNIVDINKIPENLLNENNEEFWMLYENFFENFQNFTFVQVNLNTFSDEDDSNYSNKKQLLWKCKTIHGKMFNDSSDQTYQVNLRENEHTDPNYKSSLIVALTNKDSVENRLRNKGKLIESIIQFSIHRIQSGVAYLIDRTAYHPTRHLSKHYKLEPGEYLIVPSTLESQHEVKFMLRLFTKQEIFDEDFSYFCMDAISLKYPSIKHENENCRKDSGNESLLDMNEGDFFRGSNKSDDENDYNEECNDEDLFDTESVFDFSWENYEEIFKRGESKRRGGARDGYKLRAGSRKISKYETNCSFEEAREKCNMQ